MKATLFGIIFGLIGVGMLIGGYYTWSSTNAFLQTATKAQGEVVNVVRERSSDSDGRTSYSYYPEIKFRTSTNEEVIFKSSSGSNPPSYRTGESVEVLYDPQNPPNASINSFMSLWLGTIILSVIGLVFAAIGFGVLAFQGKNSKKIAWLKQSGRRIQAKLSGVELNTSYKVNGRSPYRISCQWLNPESNKLHIFQSENLWFNPEQYINRESLDVLIDPADPGRYYVDLSFLPEVRA